MSTFFSCDSDIYLNLKKIAVERISQLRTYLASKPYEEIITIENSVNDDYQLWFKYLGRLFKVYGEYEFTEGKISYFGYLSIYMEMKGALTPDELIVALQYDSSGNFSDMEDGQEFVTFFQRQLVIKVRESFSAMNKRFQIR